MAEYIEREATIEKLNKLCDRVCQYSKAQRKVMCGACPLGDAFTVIENDFPAADVAPVRHGRWSRIDYEPIGHDYICSVCGWRNDMASHYCPNCGAKMGEEEE